MNNVYEAYNLTDEEVVHMKKIVNKGLVKGINNPVIEETKTNNTKYGNHTLIELKKICKEKGIKGY